MNFYKTLDVSPEASQDEIKKAFRNLALKFHPDRNPNDLEAEKKFKEVNAAYEILGDPQKRSQYDNQQVNQTNQRSSPFIRPEEIFNDLFGGLKNNPFNNFNSIPGFRTIRYIANVTLTLSETLQAQEKLVTIQARKRCADCKGVSVLGTQRCDSCKGAGCQNCGGTGIVSKLCSSCNGQGYKEEAKEIRVNIPRGVVNGIQIQTQIPEGMLNTVIHVTTPEGIQFGADGRLLQEVFIPYHIAILGGNHPVEMIDGNKINVKFPTLKNGQMIKIKERGLYAGPTAKERGDLFLVPRVDIPKEITDDQKTIIEQLAKIYNNSL